jgi:hypothetical protein
VGGRGSLSSGYIESLHSLMYTFNNLSIMLMINIGHNFIDSGSANDTVLLQSFGYLQYLRVSDCPHPSRE